MNSSQIQSQLKLNAGVLKSLYDEKRVKRTCRKIYNEQADCLALQATCNDLSEAVLEAVCKEENALREQANIYTPFINKFSKRIKALEQLQKALKRDLQEAYTIEQFEKEWEVLPDVGLEESFLAGRVRMAVEDGFVEPGVVAEIVEVK